MYETLHVYSKFIVSILIFYMCILLGPEKKFDRQKQVYVIRWHPSQYSADPIEEIILDDYRDPKHVIKKVK